MDELQLYILIDASSSMKPFMPQVTQKLNEFIASRKKSRTDCNVFLSISTFASTLTNVQPMKSVSEYPELLIKATIFPLRNLKEALKSLKGTIANDQNIYSGRSQVLLILSGGTPSPKLEKNDAIIRDFRENSNFRKVILLTENSTPATDFDCLNPSTFVQVDFQNDLANGLSRCLTEASQKTGNVVQRPSKPTTNEPSAILKPSAISGISPVKPSIPRKPVPASNADEQQKKINSLSEENQKLREQIKILEIKKSETATAAAVTLNKENTAFSEKLKALEKQNATLLEKANALGKQNAMLTEKANALDKKNATLTEKANALDKQNTTLTEKASALEKQNTTLTEKASALEKQNTTITEKANTLEQQNSELQNKLQDCNKVLTDTQDKLTEAQKVAQPINEKNADLQKKADSLTGQLAEATDRITSLQKDIDDLKTKLEQKQKEVENKTASETQALNDAKEQIKRLQESLKDAQPFLDNLDKKRKKEKFEEEKARQKAEKALEKGEKEFEEMFGDI